MTAFEFILLSAIEFAAIVWLIWGFRHEDEIIAWENRMLCKAKRWFRTQLRKSDRIVAWAEKPTKHGRPDEEWIAGQVKVWGDWQ